MPVRIIETSKFDLNKPLLIEGFPGIGLVGTIAASYLVEKFEMEPLGYIVSERFPPIAAVHDYLPLHPARIYKSRKLNLIVLFSEFIVPLSTVHDLACEILSWSKKRGIREIISMGGIGIKGEQDEVFGIATNKELLKRLEAAGVQLIKEGATTGVSGVLMAEAAAQNFPAVSLLAEAKPEYLDPRGAAMVLDAVRDLTGLPIETKELLSEAKNIESKIKEILEHAKTAHQKYRETGELGPMYG
ncbi:MAG: proteasome assembly chaperone family protein [Candidatus Micrarchaeia archaeon]